jgi:hypothetical protein
VVLMRLVSFASLRAVQLLADWRIIRPQNVRISMMAAAVVVVVILLVAIVVTVTVRMVRVGTFATAVRMLVEKNQADQVHHQA